MAETRSNPKKHKTKRCSNYLPPELLTEVLARLPAKSLLKLQSVCKSWKSLIQGPGFFSTHLNLSKNHYYKRNNHRDPRLMFIIDENFLYGDRWCTLRRCDMYRKVKSGHGYKLGLPIKSGYSYLDWVPLPTGYAHGVVLYTKLVDTRLGPRVSFFAWNPTIRRAMRIPDPPSCPRSKDCRVVLCYISSTDDYKVVVIPSHWRPSKVTVPIECFSIRNCAWRSVEFDIEYVRSVRYRKRMVVLNEAVHWIGSKGENPKTEIELHIVAYDVEREKFEYFGMPSGRDVRHKGCLGVVGDQSLVFINKYDCGVSSFGLWVMEEYGVATSWVKRCRLDFRCEEYLYFENGMLYVTMVGAKPSEGDAGEKGEESLETHRRVNVACMGYFVESLVLLNSPGTCTEA